MTRQTRRSVNVIAHDDWSSNVIESTKILEHPEAKFDIVTRFTTKQLDLLSLELGGLLPLSAVSVLPCWETVLPELCWKI